MSSSARPRFLYIALAGAVLFICLVAAARADAAPGQNGSLPSVDSGQPPGPPLLYRKPSKAPQLKHRPPFSAKPLLVSGSDAYRAGEYVFQDYLYDDYGANTFRGRGPRDQGADDVAAQTDGDVLYPTAERFAGNAADIVEIRIRPKRGSVFYRVTLNTAIEPDVAIVGFGIDSDGAGGEVEWPGGAGVSSPGIDTFITAWGTGGSVSKADGGEFGRAERLPRGMVEMDVRRNQMTIEVPRSMVDPAKRAKWRYVAGAGLHDGDGGWLAVPAGSSPGEETPASGSVDRDAPAVFNLAFRFGERHYKVGESGPAGSFPAEGVWFESEQSVQLAEGTTGPFFADVDFGKLHRKATQRINTPAGQTRARILSSRLRLGEGIAPGEFPKFKGRLQPYLISIPPNYRVPRSERFSKSDPGKTPDGARKARRVGLTFTLHSLGGTYTQYATYSPNQIEQFGAQRDNIVVSPHARGTDGWYQDEAEVDVFEVWADVAHRYKLDPERTYPTGYSMGGYGTYKLGVEYPDLWAKAHTTVAPPGDGIWVPPDPPTGGAETLTNGRLENLRWIPFMNWVEAADELVPYVGPRAQQARFDELGLRSTLWTFSPGEHFTLAVLDEWGPGRDFLGDATVVRDPSRVDYVRYPDADRRKLGLVHDHAYWLSRISVRDDAGDPAIDPAEGKISARSHASGEGEPETAAIADSEPAFNGVNTIEGTEWTGIGDEPARNAITIDLENIGRTVIDGRRAGLDGRERLQINITSDGRAKLKLRLKIPGNATVLDRNARVTRRGLTIPVPEGASEIVVEP